MEVAATARILGNDPVCSEKPREAWHDLICIFKDYFQATAWGMDRESEETGAKSEEWQESP